MLLLTVAWAVDIPVGPTRTHTTIAQGIDAASNGDVLVLDAGTYVTPRITFNARTYTLRGDGVVVIEASEGPLFDINAGDLTLQDLTVDGMGQYQLFDGNNTHLRLDNVVARNGGTSARGGLFEVRNAPAVITNSTLENAAATDFGGLLWVDGSLEVSDSVFSNGNAPEGAAIYVDGTASLSGVNFLDNSGADGTLWCRSSSGCEVTTSHFQGNAVTRGAVARFAGNGSHVFADSTACSNTGSALIDHRSGVLDVDRSILFDNQVDVGGISVAAAATANLTDLHLVSNVSAGGSPALEAIGTVVMRNTLVAYNEGPGAAVTGNPTVHHNLYFGNVVSDSTAPLEATELTADPRLVGAVPGACDLDQLIPYTDSPLIDAGDPSLLDADGSVSDIGAFETGVAVPFVDADSDGFSDVVDCNDADASINPGASEISCTGVDEDCNPLTLDDEDADGDGVTVCELDCDDTDPGRVPGGTEVQCNGIDDDCEPLTIDDPDADGDGVSLCDADCDDADPAQSPSLAEVPCTGIDEDCDGATLDAPDADTDGFSTCDDCDDARIDVFPGATEVPYDGIDQDCSGADLIDVDLDGSPFPDDCDDEDPERFPEAVDVADDGFDQDCTGADLTHDLTGRQGFKCGCASTETAGLPLLGWLRRR